MLEILVSIVKLAAFATLAVLAWLAWSFRRSETDPREVADPAPRPRRDAGGERVMRAFTALLILGAVSMLAISVLEIAGDL